MPESDRLKCAAHAQEVAGTAYSTCDGVAEETTRVAKIRMPASTWPARPPGSATREERGSREVLGRGRFGKRDQVCGCCGAGPVARQPHSCSSRRTRATRDATPPVRHGSRRPEPGRGTRERGTPSGRHPRRRVRLSPTAPSAPARPAPALPAPALPEPVCVLFVLPQPSCNLRHLASPLF